MLKRRTGDFSYNLEPLLFISLAKILLGGKFLLMPENGSPQGDFVLMSENGGGHAIKKEVRENVSHTSFFV